MLIEVKPIDSKRWHGKTGKESFTRPKKIQALVDPDTMAYATGLNEEQIEKYSKLLKKDLSNQFDPEAPHDFWDSALGIIKLENSTMVFDSEKSLDFIHIAIMKASKYIANSQKDYDEGKFPEATHLIFDESEEIEVKAKKVEIKNRAVLEVNKLSKGEKTDIILILSEKNAKGKSDNFVTVAMDKLLESKPKEILRIIDGDSKYSSIHALVLECLQKSVLRKDGHKILYHDSVIGADIGDVVTYLDKDENQSLKLRLTEAVNN